MGDLTEREILTTMQHHLRRAIDCCDKLTKEPKYGRNYRDLRESLARIEGCCRQASAWREDTRWLKYGLMMEECHQRSLKWLRAHAPRTLFKKLGEALRALMKACEDLRDKAPPKLGMILPEVQRDPTERNAHILVKPPKLATVKPGGLILPPGMVH
jgi:hypothetical protein